MNTKLVFASGGSALTTISLLLCSAPTWAVGDPVRGATIFQACAAYHSTTPGEHMTGPSLAKIWQRKAGMVEGFARYSEAMKHVDLVWTDATLDSWLSNPDKLIPGTSMTFPGLRERWLARMSSPTSRPSRTQKHRSSRNKVPAR